MLSYAYETKNEVDLNPVLLNTTVWAKFRDDLWTTDHKNRNVRRGPVEVRGHIDNTTHCIFGFADLTMASSYFRPWLAIQM